MQPIRRARAVAAAAELEEAFPRQRLDEFVKTGGWDPESTGQEAERPESTGQEAGRPEHRVESTGDVQ